MSQIHTKLLILADDLTGALDSGVQFAVKGDCVKIYVDAKCAFDALEEIDVLVIDTETRHIQPEEAYKTIYELVSKAKALGIKKIYKKTDSGLRGNVGAELKAVLDALGEKNLLFIPAWPEMGRTTKDGIHYIHGKPLAESIFANDVNNPTTESEIKKIIQKQVDVVVSLYGKESEEGIVVYDCESDEQLTKISEEIFAQNREPLLIAGCAGFLDKAPKQSEYPHHEEGKALPQELFVLSGSKNEVTKAQLDFAEKKGAYRIHASMQEIVDDTWSIEDINKFCEKVKQKVGVSIAIIDTLEQFEIQKQTKKEISEIIAKAMGKIAKEIVDSGVEKTFMIIGGDTLAGFIHELNIASITPLKEIALGIVLARYHYQGVDHYLITKSGAFGKEELLVEIQKKLEEGNIWD